MDARAYKVLLIENNLADGERISQYSSRATNCCCKMECADRLATGIQRFSQQDIDAVLLNLRLPDSEGLETLRAVQASAAHVPLLVLSLAGDKSKALQALEEGAADYLIKATVDADSLERSLRYAIGRRQAVAVSGKRETGMRLFHQQLSAVLWSTDTELQFTSITVAGMNRLTSNPNELVGQTLFEFFGTRDPTFHPIAQHCRALEGEPVEVLIPEQFRQRHRVYQARYFDHPHPRPMPNMELHGLRKKGTGIPVEFSLNPLETSEGILVSITIRDSTAQKQLQRQIVELAETERLRMGRELHDTFGQQMSAIAMLASSLRQQLEVEGSSLADKAAKLDQRISEAQIHVRTLAKGLLPVEVDANGLMVALEKLASITRQLHDNGAGIAPGGLLPSAGIRIMRHRAGLIHENLQVESEVGKATMVTCTMPKDSRFARSVTKE